MHSRAGQATTTPGSLLPRTTPAAPLGKERWGGQRWSGGTRSPAPCLQEVELPTLQLVGVQARPHRDWISCSPAPSGRPRSSAEACARPHYARSDLASRLCHPWDGTAFTEGVEREGKENYQGREGELVTIVESHCGHFTSPRSRRGHAVGGNRARRWTATQQPPESPSSSEGGKWLKALPRRNAEKLAINATSAKPATTPF
jgi:hypothetical protein